MASVLPAMRGCFGSTEYYIVTMHAKELTERLVAPNDIEGWEDLSLEERYQRDINFARVKRQIVPYLLEDEDRFFGSLIVSMLNADNVSFEPINDIYKGNVPNLYRTAGQAFGFLTLHGGEVLVPLDGQHRLAALKFAITGKDEKQQPIDGLEAKTEIAEDDCTVILIKHDPQKSRKIFNKVNRYAKKTSKAENLITADDDIIAVIVREHIVGTDSLIPDRLVNTSSNTLSPKAYEFTTLSTLYEATKFYLEDIFTKINTEHLPREADQKLMKSHSLEFWDKACSYIKLFNTALHDPSEHGDNKRREIRRDFLLGKPVAQLSVMQALVRLCKENEETGERIGLVDACTRINDLNWSNEDPRWQAVLVKGSKVVSGITAVRYASQVIAYWLGASLHEEQINELQEKFTDQGGVGELSEPIIASK